MGRGKKRRTGSSKWQREHRPLSIGFHARDENLTGTVQRGHAEFHVRIISASAAQKEYTCPGCHLRIAPGTAHIVAWPADSIFGDEYAAGERRHWHAHCWKIGNT